MQDPASSWWLSVVSLNRALERERPEFKDSCVIAANIAFNASGKNSLGWSQLCEVLTVAVTNFGAGRRYRWLVSGSSSPILAFMLLMALM